MVMQFRHIVEVHTINTSNKRKRHKYSRENGQRFHYRVHLIAEAREVDILDIFNHFAIGLNGIQYLENMVVDVAEIDIG